MAYKKCIDISTFDTDKKAIDWGKVKADGIGSVIIRAGFRKEVDENFVEHIEGAIKAGMNIGIYWFSYAWTAAMAKEEAAVCLQTIKPYKAHINMPVWYDAEGDTIAKAKAAGHTITRTILNQMAVAFCDAIQADGYVAGIYFNKDYRLNMYSASTLAKYKRWYAYYNDKLDWTDCHLWQYTSSAEVDGVYPAREDVNYIVDESIIQKGGGNMTEAELRQKYVAACVGYIGIKEGSAGHIEILGYYNKQDPLPRGVVMVVSYDWCAAFATAMAIKCEMLDIMVGECSCNKQITMWQQKGRWQEKDSYVPDPGDWVYYDWQDSGKGDNTGVADHVGIVVSVSGNTMKIIEGNRSDKVAYRELKVNGKYIRGFGLPDFASMATTTVKKSIGEIAQEVIDGKWGNGDARKKALAAAGYDYDQVQAKVNTLLAKETDNSTPSRKDKYAEALQVALNTSYECGLKVDKEILAKTQAQIDKHYLYYKKPTIKNAHVSWLQDALKTLGYTITVDGSYGPKTAAVVRQFQRDHGLTVDGYAGVKTHLMILSLL